jgi:nucleotide-binding universal stress UspA family protein
MMRILAALDDSPRAENVLRRATTIGRAFGAEVHVARAVDLPPSFPPAAATLSKDPLPAYLRTQALAQLDALMSQFADVSFPVPLVRAGEPWRVIVTLGRELDVDLIVIGSHRYGAIDRVLGTIAARVVNHADRDVLVVRDRPSPP